MIWLAAASGDHEHRTGDDSGRHGRKVGEERRTVNGKRGISAVETPPFDNRRLPYQVGPRLRVQRLLMARSSGLAMSSLRIMNPKRLVRTDRP